MEKSKVYFTDMRAAFGRSLPQKLQSLIIKAGMEQISFDGKFTAIKVHFGEPGNLAYLRPNYARTVVDFVKAKGGKPFLTDCNTLYVGGRKNALDHLDAAYANGYNPFCTDCHVIIGDGLKGTDEILVPVDKGEYVKEAKIGRAVMDADVFISLSHFKGHEVAGFGGALKNIGMGCGSRAGKMEMHNSGKPSVDTAVCTGCEVCAKQCAHAAISFANKKAGIDKNMCAGCGRCIGACPFDAVVTDWDEANDIVNKKIAEYSYAVLSGRPHFHISLVIDISPYCDCHGENDVPILPDIGMFASFDPVALDIACADACNAQNRISGCLADKPNKYNDHFSNTHPGTNWRSCVEHAVKLGLGSDEYELITV